MPTFVRSDFDIYIAGGAQVVNDAEPDTLFLHLDKTGGPGDSPAVNWAPKVASLSTQGVPLGYLSTVVTAALSTNSQRYGLLCLQSQRDMAPGGGGTGYACSYSATQGRLYLLKLVNGLRTSQQQLATVALASTPSALALGWVVGPDDAWTLLVAFDGGTELLRYQDFIDPYVTGVTEGGFYDDGGSGNDFDITYLSALMSAPEV